MKNSEKYAEFTARQDWKAICELNGVSLDSFGTKKELARLAEQLEDGEFVYALTSGLTSDPQASNSTDKGGSTWLVVLTNERFLFLDCALFTGSIDVQSVRLNRVQAVSSSQGWVLGKIMVDLGSRVLTIDNCQKTDVKVLSDLANKLLRENEEPKPTKSFPSDDLMQQLERLVALHEKGLLSAEEFASAKGKLLSA